MKKDWLSNNIRSVLAIAVTAFNFIVVMVLLIGNTKASEVEKTTIIGTLSNIEIVVLSYFFGSSKDKPSSAVNVNNIENVEGSK